MTINTHVGYILTAVHNPKSAYKASYSCRSGNMTSITVNQDGKPCLFPTYGWADGPTKPKVWKSIEAAQKNADKHNEFRAKLGNTGLPQLEVSELHMNRYEALSAIKDALIERPELIPAVIDLINQS